MSAMLETYDMTMLDYPTDHDIQMHPSSSDQWFPDESKMEEDGPVFKSENFSDTKNEEDILPMTADNYAEENVSTDIEVDMEPFHDHDNDEYEMQDDDLYSGSREETLDVEVHDAPLTETPSMTAFEAPQNHTPQYISTVEHPELHTHTSPSENLTIALSDSLQPPDTPIGGNTNDSNGEIISLPEDPAAVHTFQHGVSVEETASSRLPEIVAEHVADEEEVQHAELEQQFVIGPQELSGTTETTFDLSEHTEKVAPEYPLQEPADHDIQQPVQDEENASHHLFRHDQEHNTQTDAVHSPSANTSGDPHEISEGVYIDPPPPVLLSLVPEDQFDHTLFNDSDESKASSESEGLPERVFLRHMPTLYYEPLSSVFEALREDNFIQAHFGTSESELVLEAVDLELTLSEDNIYSREVTLHDLNVLHDVSGISGLLRMRLHSSVPRFIARYQYLQEHVSKLTLDESAADTSNVVHEGEGPDTYPIDSQQNSDGATGLTSHETVPSIHPSNSQSQDQHEETRNCEEEQTFAEDLKEHNSHNEVGILDAISPHEGKKEDSEENSLPPLPEESLQDTSESLQHNFVHEVSEDHLSTNEESGTSDHVSTANDNAILDDEGNVISLETLEDYPHDEETFESTEEEDPEGQLYENHEGTDNVYEVADHVRGENEESVEHETEILELAHFEDVDDQSNDSVPERPASSAVVPPNLDHDDLGQQVPINDSLSLTEDTEYPNQGFEQQLDNNEDRVSEIDPQAFGEGYWEGDIDGDFDTEAPWEEDQDNELARSNNSSVTLSSKASKRSFDEFENGGEDFDEHDDQWSPPGSPESKRSRIH